MNAHRRARGDSDDLDVEHQTLNPTITSNRYRIPKQNSAKGAAKSGGSTQNIAFLMLGCFAIGICVHVWQFSADHTPPPLTEKFYEKEMVEFTTKFGTFTVELFPEHAPKSVENFKKLMGQGYYVDGPGFYRNEPKFLLQGGGFLVDKPSPFENLPVEYSLPSTKGMVVIARGQKADSGNSEFAVMMHDNSAANKPSADSPGFTVFGRVVQGWHTLEYISKKMRPGFLAKDDKDRQVTFDKVEYVKRLTNDNPQAKRRLEELYYKLETRHAVNVFGTPGCDEMAQIKSIFLKLRATTRSEEVWHAHHAYPYEIEALEAISGHKKLPMVYIDDKYVGGLADVQRMESDGSLRTALEKSGALAESIVWDAITKNPLVVFSKSYCPYCKKAKETLASLGAKPVVFELDLRPDGQSIQDFLFSFTGRSTVPNVFIKGKSIGGGDDTQALYQSGELAQRLKLAGAIN